ncbi:cytochrome P450 [Mycena maculata]|uniref:Cytochrome P450 n=1 Tax=Mycena maculata TaxID=230809 RepID=A0AAD7HHJ0_9AGAR|nr:cytochrome P450 [Mycena maculata]
MNLDTKTLLLYGLPAVGSIIWLRSGQKSTIPALVGSKGPISSYLAAVNLIGHATDVIQQGYLQYRNGVFRIPTLFRWDYVASGPQRVAEIAAAPEHILSFQEGVADVLQVDWTMGSEIHTNPYHVQAIRSQLTRNLGRCFPQVRDEIVNAFDDVLGLKDKEWKLLHVLPSIMQIVARTSNRLFVGLPLCREKEYLDLNIDYTVLVFTRGLMIRLIPEFLKPILAPLIMNRKSSIRHALKFLGPSINERLQKEEEYGPERPDRPNDLISWLLDLAEGEERTAPALALRILVTNMAAIHTSSMAMTAVLYDLATYPEHIVPMRQEAERVIAEEGWSKASLGSMHKIDSFIRESQRLTGAGPVSMGRKVMAEDGFRFSDGTAVPYGAILNVVGTAVHYDEENYQHAKVFDGFRFSRMRESIAGRANDDDGSGGGFFNRQMVRFFAATELKAMLAHILINYDVKAEVEGVRPPDDCFGMARFPSRHGKIFIRKRE